jgi:hypothetical protein
VERVGVGQRCCVRRSVFSFSYTVMIIVVVVAIVVDIVVVVIIGANSILRSTARLA